MEKNHRRERIVLAAILVLFAALSFSSSLYRWGFSDEIGTVADGYSHLFFDFRMGQNNPPLAKQIMTFPLLFLNVDFPVNHKAWGLGHNANGEYSTDFFFKNRVSHEILAGIPRAVNVILGCILGLTIYLWAKKLWGIREAFSAVTIYALWPVFLSYSSVAQTDIAITLFFFLSIFAFWNHMNQSTQKTYLFLSLTTGLAFATKVTSILLPPIQFLISSFHEKSFFNKWNFRLIGVWILALAILVLDYGIVGIPRYSDTFRWVMGNTMGIRESTVYLFGENYTHHILYYAALFLLKNPIPIIILSITGIILNRKDKNFIYLALPAAILFVSASRSHLQQGERFLLPAYPFLALFAGYSLARGLFHIKKILKLGTLALLLWLIFSTLHSYPYYLSYVNEYAGGPKKGWKYLSLEGGQDVKGVAQWMKKNPNSTLICAFNYSEILYWTTPLKFQPYFTQTSVEIPHYANPTDTQKEFLAIGLSAFSENKKMAQEGEMGWFLENRTPIQYLGSIWIYDITQDPEAHLHMANQYQNASRYIRSYAPYAEREFARAKE